MPIRQAKLEKNKQVHLEKHKINNEINKTTYKNTFDCNY